MFRKIWGCGRAAVLAVLIGLALSLLTEIETVSDGPAGGSVQPKDVVFINKAAYLYRKPAKGDTVAVLNYLHKEGGDGAVRVLRVCGTEGDLFTAADESTETVREGAVCLTPEQEPEGTQEVVSGAFQMEESAILGRIDGILWPRSRQMRL